MFIFLVRHFCHILQPYLVSHILKCNFSWICSTNTTICSRFYFKFKQIVILSYQWFSQYHLYTISKWNERNEETRTPMPILHTGANRRKKNYWKNITKTERKEEANKKRHRAHASFTHTLSSKKAYALYIHLRCMAYVHAICICIGVRSHSRRLAHKYTHTHSPWVKRIYTHGHTM